jgi:hypothetical protein
MAAGMGATGAVWAIAPTKPKKGRQANSLASVRFWKFMKVSFNYGY